MNVKILFIFRFMVMNVKILFIFRFMVINVKILFIFRFMVMNVKMDGRTWEQLLFILLQEKSHFKKILPKIT